MGTSASTAFYNDLVAAERSDKEWEMNKKNELELYQKRQLMKDMQEYSNRSMENVAHIFVQAQAVEREKDREQFRRQREEDRLERQKYREEDRLERKKYREEDQKLREKLEKRYEKRQNKLEKERNEREDKKEIERNIREDKRDKERDESIKNMIATFGNQAKEER